MTDVVVSPDCVSDMSTGITRVTINTQEAVNALLWGAVLASLVVTLATPVVAYIGQKTVVKLEEKLSS